MLTGKLISDEKRLRYTGTEYIKTEEEMNRLFVDHLEPDVVRQAIANTVAVAEKVEDYDILGHYQMPRFPIPRDTSPSPISVRSQSWACGIDWICPPMPPFRGLCRANGP